LKHGTLEIPMQKIKDFVNLQPSLPRFPTKWMFEGNE
jgi:hypothetical protein